MTGFAEAHGAREGARWRWEVKSVNGRGLDLRLRMPPGFDGIEPAARMLASERFKRGSLQATLTLERRKARAACASMPWRWPPPCASPSEVAAETGLAPARVDGLLALKGVIVQDEALPSDAPSAPARDAAMLETLATAFDALRARAPHRRREAGVAF